MDSGDPEVWRWIWLIAAVVFGVGEMAVAGSFFLAPFAIGATVGTTSGLECRDFDANGFNDAIVPWTGFSNDGIVYDVEGPVLTLSGSTLTLLETDATSVDITSGADTTAYSGLACGDLILP